MKLLFQDASRLQSRIRYTTKNSSRSTPTSPSRTREPQCTCMTPEQFSNMRAQRNPRMRGNWHLIAILLHTILDI